MKEIISIYNGRGIIHLKGGPSETILYVKKKPRIACFYAEIGTVWRYQIGEEIDENLLGENYQYEKIVKSGDIDDEESLSKQFSHITQLLTNGSYELHLCEFSWEIDILPAISKTDKSPYYDVYGGTAEVTATQKYLNEDVIGEYKERINNGLRPIIILIKIKDSWAIYVIDGHHKFQAYKESKVNPRALIISKLDNKEVDRKEGIKIMKELGMEQEDWIKTYEEEKETKAHKRNFYDHYSKGLETYFK
jgi:hypothetical protein